MRNRKYIYPILLVLVTVILYYVERKINDSQTETTIVSNNEKVDSGKTEFPFSMMPTSTTNAIIAHNYFTLSYSEAHEQAEWVAYELTKSQLSKNTYKRPYFIEDTLVKTKSADWRNYKNSGYDRGHLCPAGDRTFSEDAYNETFYTSNISPQDHDFNGGIWNRLEQKTRFWASKYDGVYVVSGPVLKDNLKTIGTENVSVPEEFFKIVIDFSDGNYKAIAFLLPNEGASNSFYEYSIPIDVIEIKTGIDFFPDLPDTIENKLEAEVNLKNWGK